MLRREGAVCGCSTFREGISRAFSHIKNIPVFTLSDQRKPVENELGIMTQKGYLQQELGLLTNALYSGFDPKEETCWPLVPSISLTSVFEQEDPQQYREFLYSRLGNPTRKVLEKTLASIDGAQYALCVTSGVAAITTIVGFLSSGDHIIATEQIYGGSYSLFTVLFRRMNIQATFVDTCDSSNVERAMTKNTKLVWVETPTNPLMRITDISEVAEIVHRQSDVILVVDNTFFTPYFQCPLKLGADVSINSVTKYINGHSDVTMGCVTTKSRTLYEKLKSHLDAVGIAPSPFDCYLVYRSLKTFPLRMERHMKNGLAVANFLENHPKIGKVFHPGLPSHPQHKLVKKQCSGTSGILSFYIKGGSSEVKLFIKSLKMIKYAVSLGSTGSTVCVPAFASQRKVPVEKNAELGVTDNLVRLSVGLESADDIIADISQALKSL